MSGRRSKALRKEMVKDVRFIVYCKTRGIELKCKHYRRWLSGYRPL